jgi:uncharacterized protein (TIRG00374 family)
VTAALAISAALLFLAIRVIDVDELMRLLAYASFSWLAVSLAFYWVELLLRTQRWSIILRPVCRLPFRAVTTTLLVGYAANNVFPARLGELFRADFVARRYGISRFSAVSTIVIERLFDMAAVVTCAAIGMLYMLHSHLLFSPVLPKAMLVAGSLVAIACVAVFFALFSSHGWLLKRFPRIQWALAAAVAGLRSVNNFRQILALTALTAIIWLCNAGAMWATLSSVGIVAHPAVVLLLIGTAGLAAAIPSAPANLGTLQFAFITVLTAAGEGATPSFAAAVLVQVFLLGSVTAAGAVFYAAWTLRRTQRTDAAS